MINIIKNQNARKMHLATFFVDRMISISLIVESLVHEWYVKYSLLHNNFVICRVGSCIFGALKQTKSDSHKQTNRSINFEHRVCLINYKTRAHIQPCFQKLRKMPILNRSFCGKVYTLSISYIIQEKNCVR